MLLSELDFIEPMKLVYQVRVEIEQNPDYVKDVQKLTLNQSKPTRGLNGTYGLYGSIEWLNNLESGVIPRKKIFGIIQSVYKVSMDESVGSDTMDILIDAVSVPVIASGGVGNLQHLADGILQGRADAVLAASIFHFGEYTIPQAKAFLSEQGIVMREV